MKSNDIQVHWIFNGCNCLILILPVIAILIILTNIAINYQNKQRNSIKEKYLTQKQNDHGYISGLVFKHRELVYFTKKEKTQIITETQKALLRIVNPAQFECPHCKVIIEDELDNIQFYSMVIKIFQNDDQALFNILWKYFAP